MGGLEWDMYEITYTIDDGLVSAASGACEDDVEDVHATSFCGGVGVG